MRASPTVQPRSPDGAICAATGHHSSTAPAGKPSNAAPMASLPSFIWTPPPNEIAFSAAYARNAVLAPLATDIAANAESACRTSPASARPRTCALSGALGGLGTTESGTATGRVMVNAARRHPASVFFQQARYFPSAPSNRVQPYE